MYETGLDLAGSHVISTQVEAHWATDAHIYLSLSPRGHTSGNSS